jgi:CxxH/CxxC protein (TIGR04129 family)
MEGEQNMVVVCSEHVKDALKFIFLPHVKLITEENSISSHCHLCSKKAKYKLFNYACQRNKGKQAI